MKRSDVYKLIDGERDYQDKRWSAITTISKGIHTPDEFVLYMLDYLNEAQHVLSRESATTGRPKAMEIIRKITAMGVSAMEQNETNPRQ
jgi:hypothetical protein